MHVFNLVSLGYKEAELTGITWSARLFIKYIGLLGKRPFIHQFSFSKLIQGQLDIFVKDYADYDNSHNV